MRPGVGVEVGALVADLGGEAEADGQLVALGNGDARADVGADPLPAAVGLDAGELVEAGLEPLVEAVGDFQGLVDGVIGGQHAVDDAFGSRWR